ncbi:DUF2970 domain-containing protein [Thioalkalivibrio thiocyanodenitrificans]|uniref:DUF2970 domain-containing protein n=1 Tax=Thioalkalivibrio thiocyanodenitrificans TaxID=243063 RepID=UPI00037FF8D5|nr:DUF2970 domain-containing protein [Thioalkalivibrio thiocyanodenitrificans]
MNQCRSDERVSFWDVLKSVLSAFFGVQNRRNRERDFRHGKPIHFVVVGLLATLLFVLTVFGVVRLVLWLAGV